MVAVCTVTNRMHKIILYVHHCCTQGTREHLQLITELGKKLPSCEWGCDKKQVPWMHANDYNMGKDHLC